VPDRAATVSVEIDGKAVGAALDAYAPAVLPSGPIEVASGLELSKGQHRIRFAVIATNSASLGHGFGVLPRTAALRRQRRRATCPCAGPEKGDNSRPVRAEPRAQ
jgi:hypothetical protein